MSNESAWYVVCWVRIGYRGAVQSGVGPPLSRADADEWCAELNRGRGAAHHWVAPILLDAPIRAREEQP